MLYNMLYNNDYTNVHFTFCVRYVMNYDRWQDDVINVSNNANPVQCVVTTDTFMTNGLFM